MKQHLSKSENSTSSGPETAGFARGSSMFPGGRQGFGDEGLPDGREPEPGRLRLLAVLLSVPEEGSLPLVEELAQAYDWLREPVAELLSMPLGDWQAEHTRLFVSDFPKTACPPFESAYRKGLSGGLASEELNALYLKLNLEASDVSADYLGTILECAAHLLESPERTTGSLWNELWQEHVVTWAPKFASDLRSASRLLLYRRLAEQLLEMLPHDQ